MLFLYLLNCFKDLDWLCCSEEEPLSDAVATTSMLSAGVNKTMIPQFVAYVVFFQDKKRKSSYLHSVWYVWTNEQENEAANLFRARVDERIPDVQAREAPESPPPSTSFLTSK